MVGRSGVVNERTRDKGLEQPVFRRWGEKGGEGVPTPQGNRPADLQPTASWVTTPLGKHGGMQGDQRPMGPRPGSPLPGPAPDGRRQRPPNRPGVRRPAKWQQRGARAEAPGSNGARAWLRLRKTGEKKDTPWSLAGRAWGVCGTAPGQAVRAGSRWPGRTPPIRLWRMGAPPRPGVPHPRRQPAPIPTGADVPVHGVIRLPHRPGGADGQQHQVRQVRGGPPARIRCGPSRTLATYRGNSGGNPGLSWQAGTVVREPDRGVPHSRGDAHGPVPA